MLYVRMLLVYHIGRTISGRSLQNPCFGGKDASASLSLAVFARRRTYMLAGSDVDDDERVPRPPAMILLHFFRLRHVSFRTSAVRLWRRRFVLSPRCFPPRAT